MFECLHENLTISQINMYYLSGAIFISVIFSLESRTVQNEEKETGGLDTSSNEWSHQKWDSIFKLPTSTKCSDKHANELKDKSSKPMINSYAKHCKNNFKDKIVKQRENVLKDLSEDEIFAVTDPFKNLGMHDDTASFAITNSADTVKDDDFLLKANQPTLMAEDTSKNSAEDSLESKVHVASVPSQNPFNLDDSDFNNQLSEAPSPQRSIKPDLTSFIFNPNAQPLEQFQNCTTPKNESGICRYLQHCMIPNIVSSFNQFMGYVCIIEERYIGVCCPNLPASIIVVQTQKEEKTKVNSTEECGISTNIRIVGGSNADPKAWPWMVALLSKTRKNFFCGGALINHRYVLSAAHCTFGIQNNEIIARLGEYDFRDDGKFRDDYAVVEIKRHGHYNRRTLRNDIALLKLEKSVDFTEFIKAICFPEGEKNYVGENATLAGWGNVEGSLIGGGTTSDILQVASFPVISNEKCANVHGVSMPLSLICTSATEVDKGACNGDSGGPLMLLDKNNRWKVIGLVSWGRRGCNPEFPTVYTRVSHYLKWIQKHSSG